MMIWRPVVPGIPRSSHCIQAFTTSQITVHFRQGGQYVGGINSGYYHCVIGVSLRRWLELTLYWILIFMGCFATQGVNHAYMSPCMTWSESNPMLRAASIAWKTKLCSANTHPSDTRSCHVDSGFGSQSGKWEQERKRREGDMKADTETSIAIKTPGMLPSSASVGNYGWFPQSQVWPGDYCIHLQDPADTKAGE